MLLSCAGFSAACTADAPIWRPGDVVAVGDGKMGGQMRDFQLKAGDTVLYNKFGLGVTDLEIQGVEHMLIREDDCIGIMPRSGATAADIPELRPLGDRVLVKARQSAEPASGPAS